MFFVCIFVVVGVNLEVLVPKCSMEIVIWWGCVVVIVDLEEMCFVL